jgi:general secretion pathway protein F
LELGQALPEVLADPELRIPTVYRVVVEAGLRAGRLAAALESVARSSRWLSECRRMVVGAVLYPLLLFLIAWASFVWFVLRIAPALAEGMREFGAFGQPLLATIASWGATAMYWGPTVPAFVLLVVAIWWYRAARATILQPRTAGFLLGWMPWLGAMFQSLRIATFAEVLATLVENDVPLDQAVTLAAASSGDRRMTAAAERLAAAIARGESLAESAAWVGTDCPPLVRWLMAAGQQRGVLLAALRQAADTYRRRAIRQADLARLYVPVALTLFVGGTVTLLHALAVFGPWASLLDALLRLK